MKIQVLFTSLILASSLFGATASATEEDLRTLVRGGCLDESNCCFGRWKVSSNADVYSSDDAIEKVGTVKAGEEIEALAGRVHSDPGKLKVTFSHGNWKKGQVIGLYSEPDQNGKARIGNPQNAENEDASFVGIASKCKKPSKDCWATALSHPKVKWWIKVKLPEDRTGWVESTHIQTDSECKI